MATNQNRGFAGMDPDRQREIASEGGRASHESGNAHEWDSREASEAGRLGGRAAHHHSNAAFHHDTAAHHHRQAAHQRRQGRHDEAELHSNAARGHEEDARYHGNEARRHGRGFAGLDSERQREIAREGGRASHGGRDDGYESRGRQDESRGRQAHAQSDRDDYESSPRATSRGRDDRDDRDDEWSRNGSTQPRNDRGEYEARR